MKLNTNEKIEPLGNEIAVVVSDGHTFSTDTLLLADFAKPLKHEKAAEFGTGCMAIPLFWVSHNMAPRHTTAIEIQQNAVNLAKKSATINNLEDKINVICADVRNKISEISYGTYDLVVCNPPYKAVGCGLVNADLGKLVARHEQTLTIDDVTQVSFKFLRFGGRLCMCHRVERLCDVITSMRNSKIEPKRLRFVQQRKDTPPKLFLIEGKSGRNAGITVLPTLLLENDDTSLSEELCKIYRYYGENKTHNNDDGDKKL